MTKDNFKLKADDRRQKLAAIFNRRGDLAGQKARVLVSADPHVRVMRVGPEIFKFAQSPRDWEELQREDAIQRHLFAKSLPVPEVTGLDPELRSLSVRDMGGAEVTVSRLQKLSYKRQYLFGCGLGALIAGIARESADYAGPARDAYMPDFEAARRNLASLVARHALGAAHAVCAQALETGAHMQALREPVMLHGDLNPRNLRMNARGAPFLGGIDFGESRRGVLASDLSHVARWLPRAAVLGVHAAMAEGGMPEAPAAAAVHAIYEGARFMTPEGGIVFRTGVKRALEGAAALRLANRAACPGF